MSMIQEVLPEFLGALGAAIALSGGTRIGRLFRRGHVDVHVPVVGSAGEGVRDQPEADIAKATLRRYTLLGTMTADGQPVQVTSTRPAARSSPRPTGRGPTPSPARPAANDVSAGGRETGARRPGCSCDWTLSRSRSTSCSSKRTRGSARSGGENSMERSLTPHLQELAARLQKTLAQYE